MSNEELFVAIHKSKKKLNIKLNENDNENENLSPYGSMNFLVKTPAGTRHSWSPESQKTSSEVIAENHRFEDGSSISILLREIVSSLVINLFNIEDKVYVYFNTNWYLWPF